MAKNNNHKAVSYNKWGYIFLIPFVVVYLIFQLIPLISTVYNSFFENYRSGLTQIGPNFVGFANYVKLFEGGEIWIFFKNTMIMWVIGFVPQILVSLLLAACFSIPACISIALIGPPSANKVKNNIAKADAMIRFGRYDGN